MAPARTTSTFEVSGGEGHIPSSYTHLPLTMPLLDHPKGQTPPTVVSSRTVNKEQAYEQDAKNAVGIAVGVTFGLLGLVLAIGIFCCVSWSKSKRRNKLGGWGHRAGAREVLGQPQHPRVRFVRNRGGGHHIRSDIGCLEFFYANCCGVGYSSSRGGRRRWSNSTSGRGGLGVCQSGGGGGGGGNGGGNGGGRLFGRGYGNNNYITKLDERIGRYAQRPISRTAPPLQTRGRNGHDIREKRHQLRASSRNDRIRRSRRVVRKSSIFPLTRIPLPARPSSPRRGVRDHTPMDGNRVGPPRARSTRYQKKSPELRQTAAVPSQAMSFSYESHRRGNDPSNIRHPPRAYIPGSSMRPGQVREAIREDGARRIREIHTRVRSRSGPSRTNFLPGGGGPPDSVYRISPPGKINATSSQPCQLPSAPWPGPLNIPPPSCTYSEDTQCSSQLADPAEYTCCQSSCTSSLGAPFHFLPPESIPGSASTFDDFTSKASAEPVMSSDFGCYSLEELESRLETITEDEFHKSTCSSLWSIEPFNHEQKCPSIEMEHPGSLVNFCSSTTAGSAGPCTVRVAQGQEPSDFTAPHSSPQADAEGAAATFKTSGASSSQPWASKRPQSPGPSNQSPGGYGRTHISTPTTITTQTERPTSSAGYPRSSTATTCTSAPLSAPPFKTPNGSPTVNATPCANPDTVTPFEACAPTALSPTRTEIIPNTSGQLPPPGEQEAKSGEQKEKSGEREEKSREQEEPEHKSQGSEDVRSNVSSSPSFPIHHDGCSICTFVPYQSSNANSVASPRTGSFSRSTPFPPYRNISPRETMLMHSSGVSPNSQNAVPRVLGGEPIVDLQRELQEAQLRQELERLGGEPNRVAGPAASLQATVESVAGDSDDTGGVDV